MQQTTTSSHHHHHHHQNYGTMEGNQNINASPTGEASTAHIIDQDQPPKPAVRRKMQTQKLNSTTTTTTTTTSPDQDENLANCSATTSGRQNGGPTNPAYAEDIRVIETQIQDSIRGAASQCTSAFGAEKKHASSLPLPEAASSGSGGAAAPISQRPYPRAILFIVANEFCERFSYYGLRTILVLYFRSVLGFSDARSTVSFHAFATLCYLTPILGAVLADSVWGKFKTILYLSVVYLLGELTLMLASIFWHLDGATVAATFLGLALIGIGTGGIKPCVCALGGDQFLSGEQTRRENFFSLFYAAINIGALLSTFATPMLRSRYGCFGRSDCYPLAFALPCLLMFCSLVLFLVARKRYVLHPLPSENVLLAFVRCSYLAFKRKLGFGHKPRDHRGRGRPFAASPSREEINATTSETSDSNLSISSDENANQKQQVAAGGGGSFVAVGAVGEKQSTRVCIKAPSAESGRGSASHWLYLASDRFDAKSIEDFKSVWSFILLILPTSVYWCLFDQQSSLWTLQATRMEPRLFVGERSPTANFWTLEPDQMSLLNPLLLLTMIPIFQLFVFPLFNRCNILNTPVQKMTAGGLVAALTFVSSALIEVQIQRTLPSEQPRPGYARLLLVNGLNDCTLDSMKISYVPIPNVLTTTTTEQLITASNHTASNDTQQQQQQQQKQLNNNEQTNKSGSLSLSSTPELALDYLEPLNFNQVELLTADSHDMLNNYKFQFKLSSSSSSNLPSSSTAMPGQKNTSASQPPPWSATTSIGGCPFDLGKENEFIIRPLANNTAKLLYLDQGNGKLTYKLFNDSLALPAAGKTRVRLLFEAFGSYSQAEKRSISLVRLSDAIEDTDKTQKPRPELEFKFTERNGQVLLSDYIEISVPSRGAQFVLKASDGLFDGSNSKNLTIKLEPGTRNLILIHQMDADHVEVEQKLLQDNNYRISILYQIIPYLLISISEVLFSITILELAYQIAPDTMKSIFMAIGSLTTALGNMLTVLVESLHLFDNVVHDFLFYAALMAIDSLIFAYLGYRYTRGRKANRPPNE